MKKAFFCGLASASVWLGACGAELGEATVRQRWPWSEKVDIDFALPTSQSYDVELTATWAGNPTGVKLAPSALEGRVNSVTGTVHVVWDPSASGFGGKRLSGVKVQVSGGSFSDRRYLVVDLATGDCEYLSAVPEGGWTDVHKSDKMVFARCPAGTYRNGDDWSETYAKFGNDYTYMSPRTVTLTSDFYMGIYPVTHAQASKIQGVAIAYGGNWQYVPDTFSSVKVTYKNCRGSKDDTPKVLWPETRYYVSPTSHLGILRERTKAKGFDLLFDLPEEEQWEIAARAGTNTLYPNGGTVKLDDGGKLSNADELKDIVNQVAQSKWHPNWNTVEVGYASIGIVGSLAPNAWGLYDVCGGTYEFCLDLSYAGLRPDSVDPTGSLTCNTRDQYDGYGPVVRSYGGNNVDTTTNLGLSQLFVSRRVLGYSYSETGTACRFAVHLNPLDFNVH